LIYAGTYSTVIATTNNFATGLVGTIGVRILGVDSTGTVTTTVSRRTTGISEAVATSGFYVAAIDLTALASAPAPGHYIVMWDNGAVTPGNTAFEDLLLHKTTTLSAALREINAAAISHNAENVSVGFFVA
jgi:hypothetical protein